MSDADAGVILVQDLVVAIPFFEDPYDEHVWFHHGVLPHVFFWDAIHTMVQSYLEDDSPDALWRQVLAFVEEKWGASKDGDIAIGTSFLHSLPMPGSPGYGIVEELGPKLREGFSVVRPAG